MSLARLVVIEGPDAGREFELPMRGGVVGRGEGSLVQLTDPMVSRQHGVIELRDGVLCWVDDSGKPRTLINGKPTALHSVRMSFRSLASMSSGSAKMSMLSKPMALVCSTAAGPGRAIRSARSAQL